MSIEIMKILQKGLRYMKLFKWSSYMLSSNDLGGKLWDLFHKFIAIFIYTFIFIDIIVSSSLLKGLTVRI